MNSLVLIEVENNSIKTSSIEAISYARQAIQSNGNVTALCLHHNNTSVLEIAGNYGASHILYLEVPHTEGNIMLTAELVAQAAVQTGAQLVVFPRTSLNDAVAPRVAVKLKAQIASNVVSLPETTTGFVVRRSIYTGKAFADVNLTTDIKVITIKKNIISFKKSDEKAQVIPLKCQISNNIPVKLIARQKTEGKILLPEADKVVSAGRGLKGPENWVMIETLAQKIGAATACSKPVSDADWRPHHEHVGQTGIKISPNLYIAVGISGAIQHLAGVSSSKTIVVINKDAEAPFFKVADYGIVGDAFEVIPKLNSLL